MRTGARMATNIISLINIVMLLSMTKGNIDDKTLQFICYVAT